MTAGERAHPFTLGAVTLACIAMALVLPTTAEVAGLYVITAAVAWSSGAGRGVVRALLAVLPIWVLLFVLQVLLGLDPRVTAPWGGTMSAPGVTFALSQGSRLAVIATASLSFAMLFDPHRFLQAAIAKRWSFGAAFLVVATLDAADRLGVQARQLREAQRTRGVQVSGSLGLRMKALPALIFPLLLVSLTEADDRTLALDTRGLLLSGHRTAFDPPRDTVVDVTIRWTMALVVVAAVVWRLRQ